MWIVKKILILYLILIAIMYIVKYVNINALKIQCYYKPYKVKLKMHSINYMYEYV